MNPFTSIASFLGRAPRPMAWILFGAWMALIFQLSSQPPPEPGSEPSIAIAWLMNLRHAPEFGMFAVLCAWVRARRHERLVPDGRRIAWIIVVVVAYGASDEWHQSFVPGRDASACDVLTDIAGAWLSLTLLRAIEDDERRGRFARILAFGVPACVIAAGIATLVPRHWPDLTWL